MVALLITLHLILPTQLPESHTEKWRKGWMGTRGARVGHRAPRLEPAWTGNSAQEQKKQIIRQKTQKKLYASLKGTLAINNVLNIMKKLGWGGVTKGQFYVTKKIDGPHCHVVLKQLGIPFTPGPFKRGMKTPVSLPGKMIGGIFYRWAWGSKKALIFDCPMVVALYFAAPIFMKYGFDEILYTSTYRYTRVSGTRRLSRHASGMAIDIKALRGPHGRVAVVERDWMRIAGTAKDCVGPLPKGIPRTMREMICEFETWPIFRRILTPDYDHGHRDHFHVSGAYMGEVWRRRRYAGRPLSRPLSTYYHKKILPHKLPPRPTVLEKRNAGKTPVKKPDYTPPVDIPETPQSD
ncbi:extensin family protein [Myxococcota bacterium]|nr:extensin family protein [Myxococcota bacterium]MBU1534577.1 extensin family protein [Myxococcota bacterium]